jgi:hypothetical protein
MIFFLYTLINMNDISLSSCYTSDVGERDQAVLHMPAVVVVPVGIAAVVRIPVVVAHMPAAVAHTAHIHLHSSVRQHRILFLSGL